MQPASSSTKPHFPILDGLRGVAASLVVAFHLFEPHFRGYAQLPVHHGYLAVDFFFLLSGFVVGYAYDDRWSRMSVWEFFKIRLLRLHPLVILGTVFGALSFWFDPNGDGQQKVRFLELMGIMLLGFTLLPYPDLRGWNETHSLNGPSWSLLQEYLANCIYALVGRKLSKPALWAVVIVSGIAMTAVAVRHGTVGTGWAYKNCWVATVRMMFPFFAGLLLFRTGKLLRIPMAFVVCSLALIVLFMLPTFKYNGWYEAACIIVAFPLLVAAGAGGQIQGRWAKVCKFFGDISYPLYITHYPFIYLYISWVMAKKPAPHLSLLVGCGVFVFVMLLAYGAFTLYDEPVGKWLKRGRGAAREIVPGR